MPSLSKLKVCGIRNIDSAELELNPKFNVLYGLNGAGKTSFLEAISLLSTGRSFRSNKSQYLIQNGQSDASVYGRLKEQQGETRGARELGVFKSKSEKSKIKIDKELVKAASDLARQFPILAIDPGSFGLLEGGPQLRRSFLDWLVFHVKHDFFQSFKDYSRCLKQRNILLRSDKIPRLELEHWDKLLCDSAVVIDNARRACAQSISTLLQKEFNSGLEGLCLDFEFRAGWGDLNYSPPPVKQNPMDNENKSPDDQTLRDSYLCKLDACFDRDSRAGYSTVGSHRFDLIVKAHGKPASEVLSRGQKKQLVICLHLAVAKLFHSETDKFPVLLLDDLPSELDSNKLAWLLSSVKDLGLQTFITSIEALDIHSLINLEKTEAFLFHVKHGKAFTEHDFGSK